MANAPCARLTKFINPSVTASPQASTNSSMPYATPSNRMVAMAIPFPPPFDGGGWRSLFLRGLHRVLDVGDGGELDVVEFAADLLDLADVDVLDDVARLGIDRDRPARAFPCHAL